MPESTSIRYFVWAWTLRYWRLLMILAAIPAGLIAARAVLGGLQPTLCEAATQGTLPWPIAPDSPVHVLGSTHLQMIQLPGFEDEPYAHEGIDIMAQEGTEVRAVTTGTVVHTLELNTDSHYGIVVETQDDPGKGFLYLHLKYKERLKEKGDPVQAGEVIGYVVQFPLEITGGVPFDHLHLEAVKELLADDSTPTSFTYADAWDQFVLIGNPLEQLVPPEDDVDPEVLTPSLACPIAGSTAATEFVIVADETGDPVDPDALSVGQQYDVVACVRDGTHSVAAWDVMPYCVGVRIEQVGGPLAFEHAFRMRGLITNDLLIDPVWVLYSQNACLESSAGYGGPRSFYLITTNSPQGNSYWEPLEAGEYDVTVQLRDSTGKSTDVPPMRVTVLPTN